MNIPQISKIEMRLKNKTDKVYEWDCFFKLKNEESSFSVSITYENRKYRGWMWDYFKVHEERNGHINSLPFSEWSDHIFRQCMMHLFQHSIFRLRFFHHQFDPNYAEFLPFYEKTNEVKVTEEV